MVRGRGVRGEVGKLPEIGSPWPSFLQPLGRGGVLSTRVNAFVQLLCSIQHRAIREKADDASYELHNPQDQIQKLYHPLVVRALIHRLTMDEMFKQNGEIAKSVLEELEKVFITFHVTPLYFYVTTVSYSLALSFSLLGHLRHTAQRLQLAVVYTTEKPKRCCWLRKQKLRQAEAKDFGGVGVAWQRQVITDGLRENILNFSHEVGGTSVRKVMDLIMSTLYIDTIKDLGNSSKNTTIFIPHGRTGHVRDISGQVRNGTMEEASGQAPWQF
ncbi:hypothetical protein MLD38_019822 [Melastoma candidum]|uniref:Uncharacterized protein n=1 Tax=Melastoma candidum TaxID=119954 RepID=A0ACB9QBG2_9MYRT|nr:hypothetical protein MLD38_019822 [Melastoma candidum]